MEQFGVIQAAKQHNIHAKLLKDLAFIFASNKDRNRTFWDGVGLDDG
jgi:hypothetical protein